IEEHLDAPRPRPYMVWVHYVEPHAPYRLHKELVSELGIPAEGDVSRSDRYDTEVAFVDRAIGRLLAELKELSEAADTLILFASDHGESLGEHGYWGHGRHLYEMTLRVPMGVVWEGRIQPMTIDGLASNLDITPTLLGLVGLPIPDAFRGHDWSGFMLRGEAGSPESRITLHQTHKGAAVGRARDARRKGLLEVGLVGAMHKEILRVKGGNRRTFDLASDPVEARSRVALKSEPSEELRRWLEQVEGGLIAADNLPSPSLEEEDLEQLRALGYID
ncbi:MAG: sulfatase-like hydrolase/transferase, partial [bacterium]|nr:sulfatase-like hydrolase/transferase [bacterium]